MRMLTLTAIAVLGAAGAAAAQAPAANHMTTTSKAAPAATSSTMAKATTTTTATGDKAAMSKACSDQANAKGLHGKERKKFRSACKHGKA